MGDPLIDAIADRVLAGLEGMRVAKRVYSVQDAATYLGCSEDQIRHLAAAGALRCVKFDRHKRFDVRDLDAFIEREKR